MPKDLVGNELALGQLVEVKLDSPTVIGRIKQIQDGGLALGATARPGQPVPITPGRIVIGVDVMVPINPQNPVAGNMVRVVDPEAGEAKAAGE